MHCSNPNCNHEIPDDSLFCPDCGTKIVLPTKSHSEESKRVSDGDLNSQISLLFSQPMRFAAISIMPFENISDEDAYGLYKQLSSAYRNIHDDAVHHIIGTNGPLFQDSRTFLRHSDKVFRIFSNIEFLVWEHGDYSNETMDKWTIYDDGVATEAQMKRDLYGISKSFYMYGPTSQLKELFIEMLQTYELKQFCLEKKDNSIYSSNYRVPHPIRIALEATEDKEMSRLIIYLNER